LSELLVRYCNENRINWNKKFKSEDDKSSYEDKDVIPIVKVLIEVIGDKDNKSITAEDLTKFKSVYIQLPSDRKKKIIYRDKTIEEILLMDIPEKNRLSTTTHQTNFNIIITFLRWCSDNSYVIDGLTKSLQQYNKQIRKSKKESARKDRDPFDNNDLVKLFSSKEYITRKHKKPSNQWVPLMSLFTGARMKELCQLYKEDIINDKEVGAWYFNIISDEEKHTTVKSLKGRRKVPIHPKLIEMGLLDYVKKYKKGQRIFPDVVPDSKGDLTGNFSKWFGNYRLRNGVGIKGRDNKKVFHSFRHTLEDALKQKMVNLDLIEEIAGHSGGKQSETRDRYTQQYALQLKYDALLKLDFDSVIDFSKIKIRQNW